MSRHSDYFPFVTCNFIKLNSLIIILIGLPVLSTCNKQVEHRSTEIGERWPQNALTGSATKQYLAYISPFLNWITLLAAVVLSEVAESKDEIFTFTYLCPSLVEIYPLVFQNNHMKKSTIIEYLLDRLIIGYYDPDKLQNETYLSTFTGVIYPVNDLSDGIIKVQHILINTRRYIKLPKRVGLIYTDTRIEPK